MEHHLHEKNKNFFMGGGFWDGDQVLIFIKVFRAKFLGVLMRKKFIYTSYIAVSILIYFFVVDYFNYIKTGERFFVTKQCNDLFGDKILGTKVRCIGTDEQFNILDGERKWFIALASSNASPNVTDTGHNWGIWIRLRKKSKQIRIENWAPLGLGPHSKKGDLYPKPMSNFYRKFVASWVSKSFTNIVAKLYHHPDRWEEGIHIKESENDYVLNIKSKNCFLSINSNIVGSCISLAQAFRKKPDNIILLAIDNEENYDNSYSAVKAKINSLEFYSSLFQNCSSTINWIVEKEGLYNPSKFYGIYPTKYLDNIYRYNVQETDDKIEAL